MKKLSINSSLLLMLLVMLVFENSPLDLWLQQFLYVHAEQRWLWLKSEPVARLVLYDLPKTLVIIFALCLLLAMLLRRKLPSLESYQIAIRINFLSLLLTPLLVGGLKATTNVACPAKLTNFGGDIPYIAVLQDYPHGQKPKDLQRCFPAGHASAGFALFALFLFFRQPKHQQQVVIAVLILGWVLGFYKMAIGDHFFSHTMMTMLLAWLNVRLLIYPWRQQLSRQGKI